MYFAERAAQPDKLGSIPEALWWGVATATTVGYGDVYPVTGVGRLLGGALAVAGIGSFALFTAADRRWTASADSGRVDGRGVMRDA